MKLWLLRWLSHWAEILDGIVGVVTLCYYRSDLSFRIIVFYSRCKCRQELKMFDPPKTVEEAKDYRYGQWSGNPKGSPYDTEKCAYGVYSGSSMIQLQCSRKHGHGPEKLYCKQHAMMVVT
jgi:hypothetical protein